MSPLSLKVVIFLTMLHMTFGRIRHETIIKDTVDRILVGVEARLSRQTKILEQRLDEQTKLLETRMDEKEKAANERMTSLEVRFIKCINVKLG